MQNIESALHDFMTGKVGSDPAHDLEHIKRVVKSAKQFALEEEANLDIVIPAAWLHDCVSLPKNHPNRNQASKMAAKQAIDFLASIGYPEQHFTQITHAIEAHSFSAQIKPETLEAKVVQDADRMDGIGAIGVARCMLVSGSLNRSLYQPDDPFCESREPQDRLYTIDHFYQKLLMIGKSMQTQSARAEASRRMEFMQKFLGELKREIST